MEVFNLRKQDFFIIQQLAHKDKFRENSSSFFGQFWQIINPFLDMMILVVLFSTMFENKDFINFQMYVATGTMMFGLFNMGTKSCLNALVANKNFLIKTQIDRNLFVIERVYVALISFAYSFIIYVCLMIYFHIPFRWTMLVLIPDLVLFVLMIYGIGKVLAVINVLFADIAYFYQIFTLFLFYGSALFYSPANLSVTVQSFFAFNPIYDAIAIARIAVLDGQIASVGLWAKLAFYALIALFIGNKVFNKTVDDIVAKM